MSRLLYILVLVVLSFPLSAGAETLNGALTAAFEHDEAGLKLLRASGAKLGPLLTLERLPTAKYLVEVGVTVGGQAMRYPLKFSHDGEVWSLEWQPEGSYAAALLGMAKSGSLPAVPTTQKWTDVGRMPAMPVIVTRKRVVTPFGVVAPSDSDQPVEGGLQQSTNLVRAAQDWIHTVLDDDPGPAGIDLILDGDGSWRLTNAVLFNLAGVGLYQVTVVTADMGALLLAAPMRQANYVVALEALGTGFGVRIMSDGVLVPGDGCAEGMTVCVADAASLAPILQTAGPGRVMLAATGDLRTADVVSFVAVLAANTHVAPHALLVGYIEK